MSSTVGYGDSLSYAQPRAPVDPVAQSDADTSSSAAKPATYPTGSPVAGTRISYDENLRDYLNIYSNSLFNEAQFLAPADEAGTASPGGVGTPDDSVVIHDGPGGTKAPLLNGAMPSLTPLRQPVGFGTVHTPPTAVPATSSEPPPAKKAPTVPAELVKQFASIANSQQSSEMFAAYVAEQKAKEAAEAEQLAAQERATAEQFSADPDAQTREELG